MSNGGIDFDPLLDTVTYLTMAMCRQRWQLESALLAANKTSQNLATRLAATWNGTRERHLPSLGVDACRLPFDITTVSVVAAPHFHTTILAHPGRPTLVETLL